MLLYYLGKLKIQIFCRCGRKRKKLHSLFACNFVIHPQILIFSVPNVMAALPNIGGALCSTPQSLADAHYLSAVQ